MPNNREIRQLFKALQRLARKFDGSSAAKSLIYRISAPTHGARLESKSVAGVYYSTVLDQFLPNANFFFGNSNISLSDLVIQNIIQHTRIMVHSKSIHSLNNMYIHRFAANLRRSHAWSRAKLGVG